ncbi:MAG: hypothetical protein ACTFAK_03450 [Candidatus Electronema sp. VV]
MKYLEGLLPICASCRRIRMENGDWQQMESCLQEQADVRLTHGTCPDCAELLYPDCNPYRKK